MSKKKLPIVGLLNGRKRSGNLVLRLSIINPVAARRIRAVVMILVISMLLKTAGIMTTARFAGGLYSIQQMKKKALDILTVQEIGCV